MESGVRKTGVYSIGLDVGVSNIYLQFFFKLKLKLLSSDAEKNYKNY